MHKLALLRHGESDWNRENRFTGWTDVDLASTGIEEAKRAGKALLDAGLTFDVAYTSLLKRAIRTMWIVMDRMDLMWIPVHRTWRLNERHYGALQGLNKAETAAKHGDDQVKIWRRSYDIPPPPLEASDPRFPGHDRRYKGLNDKDLPRTESLKDTVARFLPYWQETIAPAVRGGQRVLIAAHGNSLRALVKHLDGVSDKDIVELNIPTGVPLLYELDAELRPIRHEYLGDAEQIRKAQEAVAKQGQAGEEAMTTPALWQRYQKYLSRVPSLGLTLDVSRMKFPDGFLDGMDVGLANAFRDMEALEKGAIANPDEKRMVGHYWLRAPELSPTPEIAAEIRKTVADIKSFEAGVHGGTIRPPKAAKFTQVVCVGIGGSALGPMFVADALGDPATDTMRVHFIDNTDPDGIARVLRQLDGRLPETLCVVASKSGGTPETRNGMLLMGDAYKAAGLEFPRHAVAITMAGSKMDQVAAGEKWLARFPMYDWVGGRTSELSAVGLLPAALQGLNIDEMLVGAAECNRATRDRDPRRNPAAAMALMWHYATGGKGRKDMVVLPYKDRLLLFSRYLQQLVMESLGKQLDLKGNRVEQGLSVYGNKGSTDQHAYVQQLREGVLNFFVVFIRVLEDGGSAREVEPGATAGDFLHGLLMGTRSALYENGRESMTITVPRVDARTVGALIALFERAVGLYASLVGINAYHQPGVEAGKKAAADVLALQGKLLAALTAESRTAEQVAAAIGANDDAEAVYLLLEHLAANGRARMTDATRPGEATFRRIG